MKKFYLLCCPDLKLCNQCFHTAFTQHSSEISVRMYISLQTKTFVACHCHKNQFTAYHTEPSHGDNISIHHTDGATGIIKFLCLGTCMYSYKDCFETNVPLSMTFVRAFLAIFLPYVCLSFTS